MCEVYRSSRLRSTVNTGYITGLGMREVCTEAVDCVVLCTRVRLRVLACKEFSADSGVSNESGFQDIMRCDHGAPLVKKSSTVVYTTCQKSSVVCYLPKVFSGAWCTTWQQSLQWCTTLKVFSGALYLPRVFSGVLSYTSGVLRTSMLTAALN